MAILFSTPAFVSILLVCSTLLGGLATVCNAQDTDHDGFIDALERRYKTSPYNPDYTPAHGTPIIVGTVDHLDPNNRFPETDQAVSIVAGGFGDDEYVLVLQGDGTVLSWSAQGRLASIESQLSSGDWLGTHPRTWRGIIDIAVAPFGLFGIDDQGEVHFAAESWVVQTVQSGDRVTDLAVSHDSLIMIANNEIEVVTNGWQEPSLPDPFYSADFEGKLVQVAAGNHTFWAVSSLGQVIGWGEDTAIAKMDYSNIPPKVWALQVHPNAASGIAILNTKRGVTFGDHSRGFLNNALLQAVAPAKPEDGVSFIGVELSNFEIQKDFAFTNPDAPIAPESWQFIDVSSSESAVYGILKGGTPLEWAVADQMGQPAPEYLNEHDWEQLQRIEIDQIPVASLNGIERASHLEEIYLENTSVNSMEPLSSLAELESIVSYHSPIVSITPIMDMALRDLRLGDTIAGDILQSTGDFVSIWQRRRERAQMGQRIESFYLGDTSNVDAWWQAFDPKTVDALLMVDSIHTYTDLGYLHSLVLAFDSLKGIEIRDLSGFDLMGNLDTLELRGQPIVDLTPLSGNLSLRELDLEDTPVADLTPLLTLHSLVEVDLHNTAAAELLEEAPESGVGRAVQSVVNELLDRGVSVSIGSATPRTDCALQFKDPVLLEYIRDILNLESTVSLSLHELSELQELWRYTYDAPLIRDLSGLEYAYNLREINLNEHDISDLSPLEYSSQLTRLRLNQDDANDPEKKSRIADLTPLSQLRSLEDIELSRSDVLDVSPLIGLPNLSHLVLNETFFAELVDFHDPNYAPAVESKYQLAELNAKGVSVFVGGGNRYDWWRIFSPSLARALLPNTGDQVHLSDVAGLTEIDAIDAGVHDLEGIEYLASLERLSLPGSAITDISALTQLKNLQELDISGNPVVDFSPVLKLPNLQSLDIRDTLFGELALASSVHDLGSGGDAARLDVIFQRRIDDYSGLTVSNRDDWWSVFSPSLSVAYLEEMIHSESYSITFSELQTVREMNFSGGDGVPQFPIDDIEGLQYFTELLQVTLQDQLVTDLEPLASMDQLLSLDLSNSDFNSWPRNRIVDIDPLRGCRSLDTLKLDYTDVLDLRAASQLYKLDHFSARGTFAAELPGAAQDGNPYAEKLVREWLGMSISYGGDARTDWWRVFDPALGECLIREAGYVADRELSLSQLADVSDLNASELWIDSLENIGLLSQLESLLISTNPIEDYTPLSELAQLTYLDLSYNSLLTNQTLDLSALTTIRSLEWIRLDHNLVWEIEPLLQLPLLNAVYLSGTFVEDNSANPAYQVARILENRGVNVVANVPRDDWNRLFDPLMAAAILNELGRSELGTFSDSELPGITEIVAAEQGVRSLEGLELLSNLERLNLQNCYVDDLSALSGLTQLKYLNLGAQRYSSIDCNLFRDLSPLADLWMLEDLDLENCAAGDYSVLTQLPSLNSVNLDGAAIHPESSLLKELVDLGVSVNTGIEPNPQRALSTSLAAAIIGRYGKIHYFENHLDLDGMGIDSLDGIQLFADLEHLSLSDNQISDIGPLRELSNLRSLSLGNSNENYHEWNQVTDISIVALLPNLEHFHAPGNMVSDASSLLSCRKLQLVDLSDNFLSEEGNPVDVEILARLDARYVNVYFHSERNDAYLLFPDPLLRRYFIDHLGYEFGVDYFGYISDLSTDLPISDLTGLEKIYHLERLDLMDSHVTNLEPLSNLKGLNYLNIDTSYTREYSLLEDLSPIAGLPYLKEVSFENQGLRCIDALLELPSLNVADLVGNYLNLNAGSPASLVIESLENVGFYLEPQRAEGGWITDPGLERALRNGLNLASSESLLVSDLESLQTLDVKGYGVTDLTGLDAASSLTNIDLRNNHISDVSLLSDLRDLEVLNLSNSDGTFDGIESIDGLSYLRSLTTLNLSGHGISDLSALLSLQNLDSLVLDGNPLDLNLGSEALRIIGILQGRGTSVIYDDRYRAGVSDGIAQVEADPETYDLFTEDQLRGLALGKPILERGEDGFELKFEVLESLNLRDWNLGAGSFEQVGGQFIWRPVNPENAKFYTIEAE